MKLFAISAESSGPFPVPGNDNRNTELTALRIVTCPDNKQICAGVFTRSDGLSVESPYNQITDKMVEGRPDFISAVSKVSPFLLNPDHAFLCFGAGYYQELFRRYGIIRDNLFIDILPVVRDMRDIQARVNMPSNAAGSKMPTIAEVAEFFGRNVPKTPEDKTNLICEIWTYLQETRGRGGNN